MAPAEPPGDVGLYQAHYANFASRLYGEIRRAAFGEDLGQTGWLTALEQDHFIGWLELSEASHLLDLGCGSGGPALRIALKTGCRVTGVDLHPDAVAAAHANAQAAGLAERAAFRQADAAEPLPFAEGSVDALICIDAINHLPDRPRVLADWQRVLKPGGRLLFTDPIVVTGPIANHEIAVRASLGYFLFVPLGTDERLLRAAGFVVERVEDRTRNMAENAAGWHRARAARAAELTAIEGAEGFASQQRFLEMAASLAAESRLSRLAFLARRAA